MPTAARPRYIPTTGRILFDRPLAVSENVAKILGSFL